MLNILIDWTGGREGCLGGLYAPGMREVLRKEIRTIQRARATLEKSNAERDRKMQALVKKIVQMGEQDKQFEARSAAARLQRMRVAYRRTDKQIENVERVSEQLTDQLTSVNVDRSIMLVAAVMNRRFQTMPDSRFQAMMIKCDEMRMREGLRQDMLDEFMDEANDPDESTEEMQSIDTHVDNILAELDVSFSDSTVQTPTSSTNSLVQMDAKISNELRKARPAVHEISR